MRRSLTTAVASAALLAGLGLTTTTASAAPAPAPAPAPKSVALASDGWCDSWRKVIVSGSGHAVHQPFNRASGSRDCTLARGSNGSAVRILQIALRDCNFASGLDDDGDFGPRTEDALEYAQERRGTAVDGVYGKNTRKALLWPVFYPNGGSTGTCRPAN